MLKRCRRTGRIAYLLYFARKTGETFEIDADGLWLTVEGTNSAVGGAATTVDGLISTQRANAGSWTAMRTKSPIGEWALALPQAARGWFDEELIEDILLVITCEGETPAWPQ